MVGASDVSWVRCSRKGRHETCWRDYVSWLAWELLGVTLDELEEVGGKKKVWSLLRLLLLDLPLQIREIHTLDDNLLLNCWYTFHILLTFIPTHTHL